MALSDGQEHLGSRVSTLLMKSLGSICSSNGKIRWNSSPRTPKCLLSGRAGERKEVRATMLGVSGRRGWLLVLGNILTNVLLVFPRRTEKRPETFAIDLVAPGRI